MTGYLWAISNILGITFWGNFYVIFGLLVKASDLQATAIVSLRSFGKQIPRSLGKEAKVRIGRLNSHVHAFNRRGRWIASNTQPNEGVNRRSEECVPPSLMAEFSVSWPVFRIRSRGRPLKRRLWGSELAARYCAHMTQ